VTSYFCVNTLLARLVGHEVKVNNVQEREDFEVDPSNIQPITKDHLKDADKAEFETHMKVSRVMLVFIWSDQEWSRQVESSSSTTTHHFFS
jgi:hypothetical protein